jgi:hypothetical protein|eukprot:COSAG01_NODE_17454_length_1150_cov_1.752617_1_plen_98_part_00
MLWLLVDDGAEDREPDCHKRHKDQPQEVPHVQAVVPRPVGAGLSWLAQGARLQCRLSVGVGVGAGVDASCGVIFGFDLEAHAVAAACGGLYYCSVGG